MRQLERLEAGLMTGNGLDPPLQGISGAGTLPSHIHKRAALQMCVTKHTHAHRDRCMHVHTEWCAIMVTQACMYCPLPH